MQDSWVSQVRMSFWSQIKIHYRIQQKKLRVIQSHNLGTKAIICRPDPGDFRSPDSSEAGDMPPNGGHVSVKNPSNRPKWLRIAAPTADAGGRWLWSLNVTWQSLGIYPVTLYHCLHQKITLCTYYFVPGASEPFRDSATRGELRSWLGRSLHWI